MLDLLIEWCWRGLVLAVGLIALVDRWPRASATTRYQIGWLTLVLVLALPLVHVLPITSIAAPVTAAAADPSRALVTMGPTPGAVIALAAGVWTLWLLRGTGSLVLAYVALRRVRRSCRPFPPEREARLATWMAHRHHGRRARLVISDEMRGASVLGPWSPLIALSPRVADGLSHAELDRIVIHELAHVVRRDDQAALAQFVIRAFAGWHPAVWWLDRRLRIEREAASDDWVVALTGAAVPYAASLVKLAGLQRASGRSLRLAPSALAPTQLSTRVGRLLDCRQNRSIRGSRMGVAAVAAIAVALSVQLTAIDLVAPRGVEPARDTTLATNTLLPATDLATHLAPVPRRRAAAATGPRAVHAEQTHEPTMQAGTSGAGPVPMSVVSHETLDIGAVSAGALEPRLSGAVAELPRLPMAATALGSPSALPVAPRSRDLSREVRDERRTGTPTPWNAAADGGLAVGQGSRKAAVKTAGFFTRLGKSIGGAF